MSVAQLLSTVAIEPSVCVLHACSQPDSGQGADAECGTENEHMLAPDQLGVSLQPQT